MRHLCHLPTCTHYSWKVFCKSVFTPKVLESIGISNVQCSSAWMSADVFISLAGEWNILFCFFYCQKAIVHGHVWVKHVCQAFQRKLNGSTIDQTGCWQTTQNTLLCLYPVWKLQVLENDFNKVLKNHSRHFASLVVWKHFRQLKMVLCQKHRNVKAMENAENLKNFLIIFLKSLTTEDHVKKFQSSKPSYIAENTWKTFGLRNFDNWIH